MVRKGQILGNDGALCSMAKDSLVALGPFVYHALVFIKNTSQRLTRSYLWADG
jgi:hypothetical protein